VITKQLTRNAAGDPVLSLRVTGADDVYRFAHGMQTLQVEFARKGTLALTGLRRMVGKANYGWLVDTFHGSGRHSEIDRRGAYERGYADATADKAECVALALHSTSRRREDRRPDSADGVGRPVGAWPGSHGPRAVH